MRIKTDFVTNSSSTCFVVMGTEFEVDNLLKLFNLEDTEDLYEKLEELLMETDLEYSFGPGGIWDAYEVMIGISYTSMNENETLRQFKDRVAKQLQEKFEYLGQVNHIEEGWYDG